MAQHKTARKTNGKHVASIRSAKKSRTSRPTKSGSSKRGGAASSISAGDAEVPVDRRRTAERRGEERATSDKASEALPQLERRQKVNRRRQIDPTTCERDYTDNEVEFMSALDNYKRRSGRMFPTCSEVLEVIRGLGYVKLPLAELEALRETGASAASAKPMPSDWAASAPIDSSDGDDCLAPRREPQMAY